jgi:ABC-2 type transport system permease protein
MASRSGAVLFIIGKLVRFTFFLFFLTLLVGKTKSLGTYSLWQVILFFVTYNFIDILAQFLLREVYKFRSHIVTGSFDYLLLKPMSPLFQSLFGGPDILDLITLFPLGFYFWYVLQHLGNITVTGVLLYIFLVINGLLIAISFHILVLALGVLTTEVDNAVWMFRNITQLGRIPIDIYKDPFRWILTYIIPVSIMISVPAKALLGLLTISGVFLAGLFSTICLYVSYSFWKYALKKYSSASS